MMLKCTRIVGAGDVKFYLGIDVSMGCKDEATLDSPIQGAAYVLLVLTMCIPMYGSRLPSGPLVAGEPLLFSSASSGPLFVDACGGGLI